MPKVGNYDITTTATAAATTTTTSTTITVVNYVFCCWCLCCPFFFFWGGGGGCFCLLMIFILYIGIVKHVVLIAVNVILLYKSPLALLPLAPSLCHCSCVCFFFLFVSVVGSSKYRVQTESWQTCTQSCDLVLCWHHVHQHDRDLIYCAGI